MDAPKLPADFAFLPDMYADTYFPAKQVDKVKAAIQKVVAFLEKGITDPAKVQKKLDQMTITINELQDDFADHMHHAAFGHDVGCSDFRLAIAAVVDDEFAANHVDLEDVFAFHYRVNQFAEGDCGFGYHRTQHVVLKHRAHQRLVGGHQEIGSGFT